MEEYFRIRQSFMEHMIAAIDSRIAVFNFSTENKYVSDKLFEMLGFGCEQENHYLQNTDELISYLESKSVETIQGNSECTHLVGIVDTDDKYIIIHLFKADDEYFGFVIDKTTQVHKNVTILEELTKFQKNSQTDSLTGVLNRSGFEEAVRHSLEIQPNKGVLCVFDMDNFKLVNDTLGHPIGDSVLKKFAQMLNESFSESAFVGRIGGDEFVVFIYDEMKYDELSESLKEFGEKVRTKFGREYPDKHLSSSIGAAMADSGINDYVSLYKSADSALYKVKQNGKGSYAIV